MTSKKKDEREVVRWVTVKGKHIPVYADGSFGVGTTNDNIDDKEKDSKKDWENGYHVEHTDSVGGKFVDKGKVGDYEIGEKVNYLSGDKMRTGTINKAHIYPNGKVDYNVVDADGDGHNVSSKNLAKTDSNKFKNTSRTTSKNAKYDTSRSKKSPSSLEAFKENARQFNDALNEATKQGALEVEFTDITGKTFHRWWNGGSWSDRKIVQDMAKRYSKKSGTFKSSFKKPKDWE